VGHEGWIKGRCVCGKTGKRFKETSRDLVLQGGEVGVPVSTNYLPGGTATLFVRKKRKRRNTQQQIRRGKKKLETQDNIGKPKRKEKGSTKKG